jgi:uncharacterized protein
MIIEGTVSNVAAFGAFIDIGVHQDGLVHVSQMANKFVSDAREIVKVGEIVKVQVTEIDIARKRIALSLKIQEPFHNSDSEKSSSYKKDGTNWITKKSITGSRYEAPAATAMSEAFAKLKR